MNEVVKNFRILKKQNFNDPDDPAVDDVGYQLPCKHTIGYRQLAELVKEKCSKNFPDDIDYKKMDEQKAKQIDPASDPDAMKPLDDLLFCVCCQRPPHSHSSSETKTADECNTIWEYPIIRTIIEDYFYADIESKQVAGYDIADLHMKKKSNKIAEYEKYRRKQLKKLDKQLQQIETNLAFNVFTLLLYPDPKRLIWANEEQTKKEFQIESVRHLVCFVCP